MSNSIEYFFTSHSPFAYLGHRLLTEIAGQHGKTVHFRPFNIAGIWEKSGSVPLAERTPLRQRYRLIELQRFSAARNIRINLHPKYFPTDPTLADLTGCALSELGEDPSSFVLAIGKAVWEQDLQIADREVVAAILEDCGHDPSLVLPLAESETAESARKRNTEMAVGFDVIGAPAYVYDGEVFWGQDRLEHLGQMIDSGRAAFIGK